MEKAIFIKKIWKQMGKPVKKDGEFKGQPDYSLLAKAISMSPGVISEHLSLVDVSTPKEVKKAVEKGKRLGTEYSTTQQLTLTNAEKIGVMQFVAKCIRSL